ncbi:MAG: hypothetical protein AB7L09_01965 [Nitrospira sp.]
MSDFVTRYVVTHIGTNGERRMTAPARQGRYTHATPEDAEKEMRDILNVEANNNDIPGVFGKQAVGTFEVRAILCWPNSHDPASHPLGVN